MITILVFVVVFDILGDYITLLKFLGMDDEGVYFIFVIPRAKRERRGSIELSNNISERLTRRKPVSEHSERASGYIVGYTSGTSKVGPQAEESLIITNDKFSLHH